MLCVVWDDENIKDALSAFDAFFGDGGDDCILEDNDSSNSGNDCRLSGHTSGDSDQVCIGCGCLSSKLELYVRSVCANNYRTTRASCIVASVSSSSCCSCKYIPAFDLVVVAVVVSTSQPLITVLCILLILITIILLYACIFLLLTIV